jgi:hypothetical protein
MVPAKLRMNAEAVMMPFREMAARDIRRPPSPGAAAPTDTSSKVENPVRTRPSGDSPSYTVAPRCVTTLELVNVLQSNTCYGVRSGHRVDKDGAMNDKCLVPHEG